MNEFFLACHREESESAETTPSQGEPAMPYRVVQPWGKNYDTQSAVLGDHATVAEAFAQIDRMTAQMVRTGAPSNAVELFVIDDRGSVIRRPGAP